jgi:basic membrane lipoprotein Med (substrate-binding protein (PBP1-ABC) superfamily)
MNKHLFDTLLVFAISIALTLGACAPTPAAPPPAPTQPPAAPTQPPPASTQPPPPPTAVPTEAPTAAPTEAGPCLTIGALYGGPITDAGYNQAMHEAVMAIKSKIDCVKIIEAENVPDEAGATTTMENMIQQGAKLIFATAFNHQYPALDLSKKYPDVKFEHAGGWEMGPNFANFFGKPPDGWYLMGQAAGKMTKSNKLGFVAAFPLGWTSTFINAFEEGAKSVNPKAETTVAYTFAWGDRAKEADTTNSLITQGVDVVTMHVDSPSTVISTAESRGAYSIGYQNLAAQQFAPEYWISGTGFTLGGKLTWLASTVVDGTWEPIFLRCGIADGCMAIAPFGPKVPQDVQDLVAQTKTDLESGKLVVFKGPIQDQNGNVKVAAGQVLTDDAMSSVDWFVKGVIGSPK